MTDKLVVQMVVGFLGAIGMLLVAILGLVVLLDKHPSDVQWTALATTTGTVIGALGTMLVSTHSSPPTDPETPDPTTGGDGEPT